MRLNRFIKIHRVERRNIEAGNPHIDDDGDLEVGLYIFKRFCITLAVVRVAQQVRQSLWVIWAVGAYQLHHLRLDCVSIQIVGGIFGCTFAQHKPLRAEGFYALIHFPCDLAVIADEHSFATYCRVFFEPLLIVPNEVLDNHIQAVWVSENDFQVRHVLFGLFNLIFIRPGFSLQTIILVTSGCNFLVQLNFSGAGQPCDADGSAVIKSLLHSILYNHLAEYTEGGIDRRSRKADICSMREGVAQVLCKAVGLFSVALGNNVLCLSIRLRPVGFVGNADDIASVAQKTDSLREFLNRHQINAAALNVSEVFTQLLAVGNADGVLIHEVFLCVLKIRRQLLIQVISVGQQDDGGLVKLNRGREAL